MELRITMKGLEETIRATERLEHDLSGKEIYPAVLSGGMLIRNRAKENAPYLTGILRRSIHIGGEATDLPPGATDIGGKIITAVRAAIEIGTNLIYAAIQEFGGTIKRTSTKGKKYTIEIPPTAYLRRAFETEKEAVVKEIADVIGILVKKWGSR